MKDKLFPVFNTHFKEPFKERYSHIEYIEQIPVCSICSQRLQSKYTRCMVLNYSLKIAIESYAAHNV